MRKLIESRDQIIKDKEMLLDELKKKLEWIKGFSDLNNDNYSTPLGDIHKCQQGNLFVLCGDLITLCEAYREIGKQYYLYGHVLNPRERTQKFDEKVNALYSEKRGKQ